MGGNAEENTAFRPMCFGTGAEGFCVIKKKKELRQIPGSEITVSRRSDRVRCEGKSNTERGR